MEEGEERQVGEGVEEGEERQVREGGEREEREGKSGEALLHV